MQQCTHYICFKTSHSLALHKCRNVVLDCDKHLPYLVQGNDTFHRYHQIMALHSPARSRRRWLLPVLPLKKSPSCFHPPTSISPVDRLHWLPLVIADGASLLRKQHGGHALSGTSPIALRTRLLQIDGPEYYRAGVYKSHLME